MRKKRILLTILLSFCLIGTFGVGVSAQGWDDYLVDEGDTFTYKVVTNEGGESVVTFMKFTLKDFSTVLGVTADFEYYNGSSSTEEDKDCDFVLTEAEINEALEDPNVSPTDKYMADKMFSWIPINSEQDKWSELWIDVDSGVALKASGTDDDGNSVSYEIAVFGDGSLQRLYESENYSGSGGGGDIPGYPFYIVSILGVFTVTLLIKKSKKQT